MNEQQLFQHYLTKLSKDWQKNKGENFLKIAEKGLKSYTYTTEPFETIIRYKKLINGRKFTKNDFKYIQSVFKKQIKFYSSLEFKTEIYNQAIIKIDKINEKYKTEYQKNLEKVGEELLTNFLIAYNHTAFENDPILQEIGEIGANLEWGNADLGDWRKVTDELKYELMANLDFKD